MKTRWLHIAVLLFFAILTVIFFRLYFFKGLVPIQFNLLPSFYSPWKYETWTGYEHGVPNKPIGTDNPKLFYPNRRFTVDQLAKWKMPLWNPYVFSGNVHHANYQSTVLYPLNILYQIMPMVDAWSILVIIQPILVGWFMFLFLKSLGLSNRSGLFGAIGYAFSGWMIAWWEESIVILHSVLWLPFALYASNIIWDGLSRSRGFLLLVLAFCMTIFAGFLQMSIYLGLTVFAWNLFRFFQEKSVKNRKRYGFIVLLALISTGLMTAVQWLPAIEAYYLSARGVVNASFIFDMFLMPARHLITLFAPDFWGNPGSYNYFFPKVFYHERVIYIGFFPLLFSLLAFISSKDKKAVFWKYFSLIVLSLGFALPTSRLWYFLHIPVLATSVPIRIFAFSAFGFCVLSAYGLETIGFPQCARLVKKILIALTLCAACLWIFALGAKIFLMIDRSVISSYYGANTDNVISLIQKYATISFRNLLLPSGFLVLGWFSVLFLFKKKTLFYVVIVMATLAGSLYFANKFLYFSDRRFEFPTTPPIEKLKELGGLNRVWGYGNGYVMRNMLSYYGLYSPEGYEALYSQRYGELLFAIRTNGIITDQINRNDVILPEASEIDSLASNPYRLRIMSLAGVRYILEVKVEENKDKLSTEERFPAALFRDAWENEKWRIWEYKAALPRVFFTSGYIVGENRQAIADKIFDTSFDLKKTLILEEQPTSVQKIPAFQEAGNADVIEYLPQSVTVSVNAPTDGFVFLSDNYYPGWKAYIDGKETKIYRADYSFRAVQISAGNHVIRFVYDPPLFRTGLLISTIGVVVFIGGTALVYFVNKKRQK